MCVFPVCLCRSVTYSSVILFVCVGQLSLPGEEGGGEQDLSPGIVQCALGVAWVNWVEIWVSLVKEGHEMRYPNDIMKKKKDRYYYV